MCGWIAVTFWLYFGWMDYGKVRLGCMSHGSLQISYSILDYLMSLLCIQKLCIFLPGRGKHLRRLCICGRGMTQRVHYPYSQNIIAWHVCRLWIHLDERFYLDFWKDFVLLGRLFSWPHSHSYERTYVHTRICWIYMKYLSSFNFWGWRRRRELLLALLWTFGLQRHKKCSAGLSLSLSLLGLVAVHYLILWLPSHCTTHSILVQ